MDFEVKNENMVQVKNNLLEYVPTQCFNVELMFTEMDDIIADVDRQLLNVIVDILKLRLSKDLQTVVLIPVSDTTGFIPEMFNDNGNVYVTQLENYYIINTGTSFMLTNPINSIDDLKDYLVKNYSSVVDPLAGSCSLVEGFTNKIYCYDIAFF